MCVLRRVSMDKILYFINTLIILFSIIISKAANILYIYTLVFIVGKVQVHSQSETNHMHQEERKIDPSLTVPILIVIHASLLLGHW